MSSTTASVSLIPPARVATPTPQLQQARTWTDTARDAATYAARSAIPAMAMAAVGVAIRAPDVERCFSIAWYRRECDYDSAN